jgi:hypothetical protein
MCAYTNKYEPFWVLHPGIIWLGIPKGANVDRIGIGDFCWSASSNEYWLATPLDGDGVSWLDGSEVNLGVSHGKDVFGGGHGEDEFQDEETEGCCVDKSTSCEDKVSESTLAARVTWRESCVARLVVTVGGLNKEEEREVE